MLHHVSLPWDDGVHISFSIDLIVFSPVSPTHTLFLDLLATENTLKTLLLYRLSSHTWQTEVAAEELAAVVIGAADVAVVVGVITEEGGRIEVAVVGAVTAAAPVAGEVIVAGEVEVGIEAEAAATSAAVGSAVGAETEAEVVDLITAVEAEAALPQEQVDKGRS